MDKKNTIKVYTSSSGAELNISAPSVKQLISATNNRAQYFAEQAQKYKDEAKIHRDSAKYYAEQNSNVTFEYVENIRNKLESKILEKQPIGNYALKEELPHNISELANDSKYINEQQLASSIEEVRLPSQEGLKDAFLHTNGTSVSWIAQPFAEKFEQINQAINSKVSLDGSNANFKRIISTYQNGSSWYRIYSDKWCEQGGKVNASFSGTINFLKNFKNILDFSLCLVSWRNTASYDKETFPNSVTVSGFTVQRLGFDTNSGAYWRASGYIN